MQFKEKFGENFRLGVIEPLRACPSKTAILSDIDGTLHPIVEKPDQIHFNDFVSVVLEKLAKKYALVSLITGRSLKSALSFIKVRGVVYIGNHGLEVSRNSKIGYAKNVQKYIPNIRSALKLVSESDLSKISEIYIEDKGVAIAVHYRRAPAKLFEVEKIVNRIANNLGLKVIKGRKVYELQPPLDIDKGTALEEIIKQSEVNLALYMGDDISDIKAFKRLKKITLPNFQAITIGIRSSEVSEIENEKSVDYLIDSVDDSIALLNSLV